MKKCLSIAGFDGSGGAGLQADLKTFSAFDCYGLSVLTALPVQNTCGVRCCYDLPLDSITAQLEAIFDDIVPDSIKIGMLFSAPIIELVAHFLTQNARGIPIVLDPVMVAKSGHALLKDEAVDTLKETLIPLATLMTPNLPEAQRLTTPTDDFDTLATKLLSLGPKAVLLKGGHVDAKDSNDLYLSQSGEKALLKAERIKTNNTHGTGCTLSAAICACIAKGMPPLLACQTAKQYLTGAIRASMHDNLGKGHGPVAHFYHIDWEETAL